MGTPLLAFHGEQRMIGLPFTVADTAASHLPLSIVFLDGSGTVEVQACMVAGGPWIAVPTYRVAGHHIAAIAPEMRVILTNGAGARGYVSTDRRVEFTSAPNARASSAPPVTPQIRYGLTPDDR